jgi:diguanylate cyclase (GGDEF)-like protein
MENRMPGQVSNKDMEKPFALIVEEDRIAAGLFRHALNMAGFESETVSDARMFWSRLAKCQPWLLILDLDMPGISGNQILEMMRSDDTLHPIKVIAVTSYSQIAESLAVEPDLLLFKPVGMEQVSDFIARFQLKLKYQTTIPMLGEPWDRVTGLYNQSFFTDRLETALAEAKETGRYSFAVLSISIDEHNRVKEQLDIRSWIAALRETAESLKLAARPTDTVARFDQDNFYLLIENIPDANVLAMIAARIDQKLQNRLATLGYRIQFPIRIRVVRADRRFEAGSEILQEAERAHVFQSAPKGFFAAAMSKTA